MSGETFAMVLQPHSQPVSPQELADEVKGIYAGLVEVEAKCISVCAAHAADPKSRIDAKDWQSLIVLHRALLYEHHDFLMATQHPSATGPIRMLVVKKAMPERMWTHGIHAFLETLRCRLPQSQDFMLAFICLAYQIMALLLESVPRFADIWTECLGDLARYRMGIEEEMEARSIWARVAARWYTTLSHREPTIGRLYHHLGILEQPSMRQFCYYAKSLTCVIRFPIARHPLLKLCDDLTMRDAKTIQGSREGVEVRILTYYAMLQTRNDVARTAAVGQDSLQLLGKHLAKLRNIGAVFAASNMAALLELGAQTNILWQVYAATTIQTVPNAGPDVHTSAHPLADIVPDASVDPFLHSANKYFADSFNIVASHCNTSRLLEDCLSFMHVSLVCLHSFHTLRTRLGQGGRNNLILFHYCDLDFSALAAFFNSLAQQNPVSARILDCAHHDVFPSAERKEDDRPLSEDYIIRGHIWAQFYFPPGWFERQDDARAIETSSTMKARVCRVLWLGLFLAFHTEHLSFDVQTRVFSATTQPPITLPATTTDKAHLTVAELPSSV